MRRQAVQQHKGLAVVSLGCSLLSTRLHLTPGRLGFGPTYPKLVLVLELELKVIILDKSELAA